MSKEVIIYTKNFCPYCTQLKFFLQRQGVVFQEINLTDKPEEYEDLRNETNFYTLPQVFVDDDFLGGYDNIIALHQKGKFHRLFGLE